jgi:methionyl-tRNA synthetase
MTVEESQIIDFYRFLNVHPLFGFLFVALAFWTVAWKGIALWKSARNNQTVWYVVMLFVNTLGILEIVYVFFFSDKKKIEQKNS